MISSMNSLSLPALSCQSSNFQLAEQDVLATSTFFPTSSLCSESKHASSSNKFKSLKMSKLNRNAKPLKSSILADCFDVDSNSSDLPNPTNYCFKVFNSSGLSERNHENDEMNNLTVPISASMVPYMKRGLGSFGGVTIERSKLDLSVKETKSTPQIDIGGGGGNMGNKNFHGGGDGGDDGGDDDDYFGGEDDGEEGDDNGILRKGTINEIFDREIVEAIMQEWFKTIKDLPMGIRQAVEMGYMSTAQLVRYFSVGSRPTLVRTLSRITPVPISRAFLGRVMADPAFIYKMAIEQAITIGTGVMYEIKSRGERLKDEWDLAAMNVITLAAMNAAVVWSLSPSRSYWSTARFDWQKSLERLPNHIFDRSYPLREFNTLMRIGSFVWKSAELSLIGTAIGSLGGVASNSLLALRRKSNPEYVPSIPVPSCQMYALGSGVYLGLSGNVRYQALYGVDRLLHQHFNNINIAIFASTALRYLNIRLGEPSRIIFLGLDMPSVAERIQNKESVSAYHRPSASKFSLSLPFDIKSLLPKEFLSILPAGILTLLNATKDDSSISPKPQTTKKLRRKVKRKVSPVAS